MKQLFVHKKDHTNGGSFWSPKINTPLFPIKSFTSSKQRKKINLIKMTAFRKTLQRRAGLIVIKSTLKYKKLEPNSQYCRNIVSEPQCLLLIFYMLKIWKQKLNNPKLPTQTSLYMKYIH